MGYTASKIVEIAKGEIGYKEKASNANLDNKTANAGSNNWTKYARDLYAAGYYNGNKNGYAWCDVFNDWCHYIAAGKNAKAAQEVICQSGPYGAGCGNSMQYYKNAGRFDKNPKIGDQIFFRYSGTSGADHTGIVVAVDSQWVTTIEGNSGNCVQQRRYDRKDSTILGYGHPKYAAEQTVKPAAQPTKPAAQPSSKKSIDEIAREVISGKWGNGAERMNKLTNAGYNHADVQARVNIILSGKSAKSVTEIAKEVIAGKWGVGSERKRKLIQAGYDYDAVQKRVNELLK